MQNKHWPCNDGFAPSFEYREKTFSVRRCRWSSKCWLFDLAVSIGSSDNWPELRTKENKAEGAMSAENPQKNVPGS